MLEYKVLVDLYKALGGGWTADELSGYGDEDR